MLVRITPNSIVNTDDISNIRIYPHPSRDDKGMTISFIRGSDELRIMHLTDLKIDRILNLLKIQR